MSAELLRDCSRWGRRPGTSPGSRRVRARRRPRRGRCWARRHRRSAHPRPGGARAGAPQYASRPGCCRRPRPWRPRGHRGSARACGRRTVRTRSESAPPQSPPKAPKPNIEFSGTVRQSPVRPRGSAPALAAGNRDGTTARVPTSNSSHVPNLHDLCHELVPERVAAGHPGPRPDNADVEVAERDGERAYHRVVRLAQERIVYLRLMLRSSVIVSCLMPRDPSAVPRLPGASPGHGRAQPAML